MYLNLRVEDALEFLYKMLPPGTLNSVKILVFEKAWEGKSYEEIALESGYGYDYVRTVGFQLWKALSEVLNEKVTKKNFRALLLQRLIDRWTVVNTPTANSARIASQPPMPLGGQLALDSPFYVYRPPAESLCYEAILQPGALVRIKAPRQMGKTSLVARMLMQVRQRQFHTVLLNLQLADDSILKELNLFFRWFCAVVTQDLGLPNQLETYWDELFGSSYNCTNYFERYVLTELKSPLVLALDNVHVLFDHPRVAVNFFRMLRAWYEKARYGGENSPLWQKLRLVVVYSTEVYVPLSVNHSPFNAGLAVHLPRLTVGQIQDLAQRYRLDAPQEYAEQLLALVGGNPYLVQLSFHHLQQGNLTIEQLKQKAIAADGIYSAHLRNHLWELQQYPELLAALKQVVLSSSPVELEPIQAFKLQSQGLVRLHDQSVVPSCDLYQKYFAQVLAHPDTNASTLP